VSLALSMRQTIEHMEKATGPIRRLILGGGHARTPLYARLYADVIGRDVVIGAGDEAMLLGTAMVAATAAGWHPSLEAACRAMRRPAERVLTPDAAQHAAFDRDYRIFLRMQQHRQELADLA
jgi:ribulose kinase